MKQKHVKTRKGVFETNSSSTHAMCIALGNAPLKIPDSLHFEIGEYGWGFSTVSSTEDKASYLYTAMLETGNGDKFLEFVVPALKKEGVKVTFQTPEYTEWGGLENGGIDHGSECSDFVDVVTSTTGRLLSFLFSNKSFVLTGNDNDDMDIGINVNYPHESCYKGN